MNQTWEPPTDIPRDPWDSFVTMRKRKGSRAPWTDAARDRAVSKLLAMRDQGTDIGEVLMICVEMGWSGVEWGLSELQRQQQRQRTVTGLMPSARAVALSDAEGIKHGQ